MNYSLVLVIGLIEFGSHKPRPFYASIFVTSTNTECR